MCVCVCGEDSSAVKQKILWRERREKLTIMDILLA